MNEQRQPDACTWQLRLRFGGTLLHLLRPELSTPELQTLARTFSTGTERQMWVLTQAPEEVRVWL